ncbi:MAG: pilus assembly protein PilP [candidate division WOR-3 bacterium]|nr:pilus assembly protein PilP [candidate division WOR-3 bacterium]
MVFHDVGSLITFLLIINQVPSTDSLFPVERYEYEPAGRRDPFVPLIGLELGGGKTGHLSPENLRLIGILWGDRGYYALVKDGQDNGYILKRGDRVAGGHVSEINRQAIIFEIMHAGVVTKYELRLQEGKERR